MQQSVGRPIGTDIPTCQLPFDESAIGRHLSGLKDEIDAERFRLTPELERLQRSATALNESVQVSHTQFGAAVDGLRLLHQRGDDAVLDL